MAKKRLADMTYEEMREEQAQNSAAWHTADKATQNALHQRNNDIQRVMDARFGTTSSFDNNTGVRTVTGGITDPQWVYDNYQRINRENANRERSRLEQLAQMSYANWKNSNEYQSLQDMYRRQATQTANDVAAQLSARTGGLASSYAAAAASQQQADVMSQLEAVARQMYEGDRNAAMDVYQLEQAAADKAYDRAMVERQYSDAQTLQRKQEAETSRADARDRVNAYLAAGGNASALDNELLKQSGYTDAEIAAFGKYYAQQLAAESARGRSTGVTAGDEEGEESKRYGDILKRAQKYEEYDDAIAYLDRMVSRGEISEDERNIIDSVYLGGEGSRSDEDIINEAKRMVESGAAKNSRTVSEFLDKSGYSEEEKELFKAYMEQWGYDAGYAR